MRCISSTGSPTLRRQWRCQAGQNPRSCVRSGAEMGVAATLNDAKGLVRFGVGVGTSGEPGVGAGRPLRRRFPWLDREALVKAMATSAPRAIWISIDFSGVSRMRLPSRDLEIHAVVVDAIEVPQAEHLEAAEVGQHRAVPAHNRCRPRLRPPPAHPVANAGDRCSSTIWAPVCASCSVVTL